MKEINIAEEKPKHTKALVAIAGIVFCVAFFAFFYKSIISFNGSSQGTTTERLNEVLSKTINEEDKNNETIPYIVTDFLGKWKGVWEIEGGTLPAALSVTSVVPGVGVTAWYATDENASQGIAGITHTITGGIVNLPKKGNQLALELSAPQIEGVEPIRLFFWFANPENRTLSGEFTHPITGQIVRGIFEEVTE